ncbi:MAG TPA: sigma-70 family RNA polymerase sigma factor [Pyrinomonadaceae bacterium]|nr:sigma-70 family RNA polymerase sigma factor [Pyrinomonadaceae bacterium]
MLTRLKIPPTHEVLFADRYERLLSWSLQLTDNDRELAEDLVHDAFIQFTFAQRDLDTIRNLDSYFYGMLRNLHLLHVRRKTRNRLQQLSIVDYDSAEHGLRRIDLRDQLQVKDQLRRVCQYVCLRKEKSKSASVLILRFFHGYYPSEISHILRTTRPTVDVHLRTARNEARAILEKPGSLRLLNEPASLEIFPPERRSDDLLSELRTTIFQSRRGDCASSEQLSSLYKDEAPQMGAEQLAHIVSCPRCLNGVNKMLNLPPPQLDRPFEVLGREKRRSGRGSGSDDGSSPAGGAGAAGSIKTLRRRAKTVIEHKPEELYVSVNGYVQGSQRITSELNELSLNINIPEQIGCVEVFSEQLIRLLLLNVDELPPAGEVEQSAEILLSEGRRLLLNLKFRSPLPTLQVVYEDPTFKEIGEMLDITLNPDGQSPGPVVFDESVYEKNASPSIEKQEVILSLQLRQHLGTLAALFLRPATITAIVAIALLSTLLLTRDWSPSVTPKLSTTELLQKAVISEEAAAEKTDQVLHRIIDFEQREIGGIGSPGVGTSISRHRIEVWHSAGKGVTARRLYDQKNKLIRGDWRRRDGVQILYQHGVRPRFRSQSDQLSSAILSSDEVWQLSPSSKDFISVIGANESPSLTELDGGYLLTYRYVNGTGGESELRNRTPVLEHAALKLNKADLRAMEMILTMRLVEGVESKSRVPNTRFVEYRFTEISFEAQDPRSVPSSVFEANSELLSENGLKELKLNKPMSNVDGHSVPTSSASALTDLEVEVTYLLNQARADLGEQVSLTRLADGRLRVFGIVDTGNRKAEIVRALSSVANNPAIRIEVWTVEEAIRQQKQRTFDTQVAGSLTAREGAHLPVDSQLRRYLSARGVQEGQIDEELRALASRMIVRSGQAMSHVFALKRLSEQFTEEQVYSLSPDARVKRMFMFHQHARAFQLETRLLREQLQDVFGPLPAPSSGSGARIEINDEAALVRTVYRLFDLSGNYNKAIGSAFAISQESGSSTINTPQFWQLIISAEELASALREATQTK